MRQLLTKNTSFKWTSECQAELDYMKERFTSDPVLQPINPNKDLVIVCDGNSFGYGWCLMQYGDDDQLHVVAYGAQATTRAQSKYLSSELELMALALALRQYQFFAVHKVITVYSDNTRVLHLDRWQPVNARQKRILTYLCSLIYPSNSFVAVIIILQMRYPD